MSYILIKLMMFILKVGFYPVYKTSSHTTGKLASFPIKEI